MYRVELKALKLLVRKFSNADIVPNVPCGVESIAIQVKGYWVMFLMYRVELKVVKPPCGAPTSSMSS